MITSPNSENIHILCYCQPKRVIKKEEKKTSKQEREKDWEELAVGLPWIVQKIVQIDIKSNIKFKTILLKTSLYNLIFPFKKYDFMN